MGADGKVLSFGWKYQRVWAALPTEAIGVVGIEKCFVWNVMWGWMGGLRNS
jgi:hypothetical protein